jgi:hypothetical protein
VIPAVKDITVKRGDTFELFARIRDKVWDAGTSTYIPGPYKNLTGWTGLSQIRLTADTPDPVLATMSVVLGNQGTTPGSFFLRMTSTVTATLTVNGVYDVQFTLPDASVQTYLGGAVTISKDVTK